MLKICKLKFTNRYELHEKVVNIPIFVDKFLHSIKFGPFSAIGIQHFGGQLLLLSIFMTGVGACRAIIAEESFKNILIYYVLAFVMLYAHFSVSAAVDLNRKKEVLKTNLIDYLENNISVRIPQSKKEQERLNRLEEEAAGGIKKYSEETETKLAEIADFAAHKRMEEKKKLEPEEIEELQGLLQEFVFLSY